MKRRDMLKTASAAVLGLTTFPFGCVRAADTASADKKVLFFTQNNGYYHAVVKRQGTGLAHAEKLLTEFAGKAGIAIECSKDGRLFDGDIDQYDAFAFYSNGDLTQPNKAGEPPMTPEGKKRFLGAVAGGKGFVGFHSSCACWRTPGEKAANSDTVDPYIAMLGGEFISHGPQQNAALMLASQQFESLRSLNVGKGHELWDEWYAMKNFADDLHVVLVQETAGMKGDCYQRPPYPVVWARTHHKGRVFFNSLGHTEEMWTNPAFQAITLAGLNWAVGNTQVDVPPNIGQATPKASQLTAG